MLSYSFSLLAERRILVTSSELLFYFRFVVGFSSSSGASSVTLDEPMKQIETSRILPQSVNYRKVVGFGVTS